MCPAGFPAINFTWFKINLHLIFYHHSNLNVKQLLVQYAAYNVWANSRMADSICSLPEASQVAVLPSSFNSLHATLIHIWNAESMWWQRMKMQEVVTAPGIGFTGTTREAANALLQQNKTWEAWIANASQPALEHVFHYRNTKQEQFRQPIYQMLLHIFNHGTYHRGQLVNMLRQLQVAVIPPTDFIVWSRDKKPG